MKKFNFLHEEYKIIWQACCWTIREKIIQSLQLKASHDDVCRFTDSFNALVMYYLGAPDSAAWLLHLEPDSEEYTQWVHQTLVEIFLPTLNHLFHP